MIFAIMLPNFIAAAGITVIASVLGIAGEIFGVSQSLAMWLMTGFMLTYVTFMPILGKLSDNYGKKKIFIASISIFTAGLLLSAVTDSFTVIIAGRLLQGLGAAGILPITNAMVSEYFPEQKGKYLAMVNATYGLGVIVGVNIGGITYESLGWKWMFLIPFIVGVLSVLTALILIREDKNREYKKKRIDYAGGILFALSITAFILMMGKLSKFSFFSYDVLMLFTLLIVSFFLFLVREMKTENPIINLSHFRKPGFLIYNLNWTLTAEINNESAYTKGNIITFTANTSLPRIGPTITQEVNQVQVYMDDGTINRLFYSSTSFCFSKNLSVFHSIEFHSIKPCLKRWKNLLASSLFLKPSPASKIPYIT